MNCELLALNQKRIISQSGTNVYLTPEMHPDRIMAEHDLLYIQEGEWTICQDSESYLLSAGDVMLLRAGSHHYSLARCAANTRNMFIHFSAAPLDRYHVNLMPQAASRYMTGDMLSLSTVTQCGQYASVRRLFRDIIEVFWSNREDKQRHLSILLDLLLSELSYSSRGSQLLSEDWIVRILRQMRTNPNHIYSLEELATLAGMSVRTLSTRFKSATGQSVYHYQIALKLEMALALIRSEPDRTLADIASNFGFYDAFQFSRLFKQKYGRSPKHFRQNTIKAERDEPE